MLVRDDSPIAPAIPIFFREASKVLLGLSGDIGVELFPIAIKYIETT